MRRYRTLDSRPRSLYSLAQQPRSRPPSRGWKPTAQCEVKRGNRCRVCGIGGILHLHHIVPRSLSGAGRDDPDNLMGLCYACHAGFHSGGTIPRSVLTVKELDALERYAPSVGWLARRYPRDSRNQSEDNDA